MMVVMYGRGRRSAIHMMHYRNRLVMMNNHGSGLVMMDNHGGRLVTNSVYWTSRSQM